MPEGIAVVLIVLGAMVGTVGGYYLYSQSLARSLRRFLGIRKPTEARILEGTKSPGYRILELKKLLRDGLESLGLTVQVKGLEGLSIAFSSDAMGASRISLPGLLAGNYSGEFKALLTVQLAVAPKKTEPFPKSNLYLVEDGDHRAMLALMQSEYPSQAWLELAVRDIPFEVDWATDLLERMEAKALADAVYRGQVLRPAFQAMGGADDLEFISIDSPRTVVLDEALRDDLHANFVAFARHNDVLASLGIPASRGLLLCGPPGTGKTTTCRYLRQELPGHTMILCAAEALGQVTAVFELARRYSPSLVVIEDVDLVVQPRDPLMPNAALKDLLNEMDGLEVRDQVMVVLTSNSWNFIETALADRPGRIDHVIFMEPPGHPHRKVLLEQYLQHLDLATSIDDLVTLGDGLTPAQLFELVKRATIQALLRQPSAQALPQPPDQAGRLTVDLRDFQSAMAGMKASSIGERRRRDAGFQPAARAR